MFNLVECAWRAPQYKVVGIILQLGPERRDESKGWHWQERQLKEAAAGASVCQRFADSFKMRFEQTNSAF